MRPPLHRRHAQKTTSSADGLPQSPIRTNDYSGNIGHSLLMSGAIPDIEPGTPHTLESFSQMGSIHPTSPPATSIPTASFKDSLISGLISARESLNRKLSKPRSRHAGFRSDWRSARYSIKPRSRSCSRFTGYISDTVSHVTEFLKTRIRKEQYSVGPYDENKLESMPDPIRRVERTLSQEWRDASVAKSYRGTGFGRRYPTISTDRRKQDPVWSVKGRYSDWDRMKATVNSFRYRSTVNR